MGTKLSATARYKLRETVLKWVSVTLVALFMIFVAVYLYVTKDSIYDPKPFDQQRFNRIVSEIQSGKLTANGSIVVLPPDLAGASITGRAYVTKGVVFIPSWVGRKTLVCPQSSMCDEWLGGYVYSEKPLNTGSIPLPGHLNVPVFCNPSKATQDGIAQYIDIFIYAPVDYTPVDSHWYTADSYSQGQGLQAPAS